MSTDLIALRTGKADRTNGLRGQQLDIVHFNQDNKILAYVRSRDSDDNEPVLVVLNFGDRPFEEYGIGVAEDADWKLRFNSTWKGYDDDFSELEVEGMEKVAESTDEKPFTGKITIPAYAALIYTK